MPTSTTRFSRVVQRAGSICFTSVSRSGLHNYSGKNRTSGVTENLEATTILKRRSLFSFRSRRFYSQLLHRDTSTHLHVAVKSKTFSDWQLSEIDFNSATSAASSRL